MKKQFIAATLAVFLTCESVLPVGAADDTYAAALASSTEASLEASTESSSDDAGQESSSASSESATDSATENLTDASNESSGEGSSEEASEVSSDASTDASSEASSDSSSEVSSDASSEASSEEDNTEVELPEGINPLPEGYEITEEEEALKDKIEENGVLEDFKDMTEGVDYAENEIVTLAANEEMAQLIAETYSGQLVDYSYGVATISLADSELSVADAFEYSLNEDYDLPLVEPNYYSQLIEPEIIDESQTGRVKANSYIHSGNYFTERWYNDNFQDPFLNPANGHYQWHHSMMNTYAAWGVTTGSSNVTVAVIDTGVNTNHNDIKGGPVETKEIVSGSGSNDLNGHGTHVAGIIAGRLNKQMGAGVAPGTKLLVLKVTEPNSSANSFKISNVWRALMYAGGLECTIDENTVTYVNLRKVGNRRADIVNLSLGNDVYSSYYERIMDAMHDAGVTVVAAMGNERANHKSYPAAYDHVISVVAVTEAGERSYYSNYGAWADVAAPGSRIYSADYSNNGGYTYMDGSSMACPMIAGACALYMSAYGHVDPDTMERVIKSSVTGSAGSGTGTGIIDLAKMFKGDATAPLVSLMSSSNVVGEAQDGMNFTVSTAVPSSATISFTPMGFDAQDVASDGFKRGVASNANKNTVIVYTTNGTTPSVSNGTVVNGTALYVNSTNMIPAVKVSDLIDTNNTALTQKITVKAIAVTGLGVSSKMTTLNFTVDKTLKSAISAGTTVVKITNAPGKLVAGKSLKLEAVVTDAKDPKVSQKVTWRIDAYYDGDMSKARINASNGTLTTNAAQTGKLVISCTTADTRATSKVTIEVAKDYAIASLAINNGKNKDLSLDYATGEKQKNPNSATISVTALTDTAKHNLLTDKTYTYSNKKFQWISSNSKVVELTSVNGKDDINSTGKDIKIKANSLGTATITCKALDGSGKSAKITVKVAYDMKATSVVISDGTKANSSVTALPLNIPSSTKAQTKLYSTVNYADGKTNRVKTQWVSSNEKVVTVKPSTDGKSATVIPVAKGTANITCSVPDGSGKKAVVKVTVAQLAEMLTISGQSSVAPGTTAKFTAVITPATANNKKVEWSVYSADGKTPAPEGVSISNGTLKLPKEFSKDFEKNPKLVIKAKALDGSEKETTKDITVVKRATKVIIKCNGLDATGKGAMLSAKSISGYGYPATVKLDASTVAVNADGKEETLSTPVTYTSSNNKIATVDEKGNVHGISKGTATITATAQDGSGKKAIFKVNVVQPVESVSVTGQPTIAHGASATFKATVGPAAANEKAVTWELEDTSTNKQPIGITIGNNGAVKVGKDAPLGHQIIVRAISKDCNNYTDVGKGAGKDSKGNWLANVKTNAIGETKFKVTEAKAATVEITASGLNDGVNAPVYVKGSKNNALSSIRLYNTNFADSGNKAENTIKLNNNIISTTGKSLTNTVPVVWTSSNPKVATVSVPDGQKAATVQALATGTTNITCTAQDGSGKKAVLKVTVAQHVESVAITGGQPRIAVGASATFKATVLPANATNKNVKWSVNVKGASSQTLEGITVTNGTVKVGKDVKDTLINKEIEVTAIHDIGDGNVQKSTTTFTVIAAKAAAVTVKATNADKDVNVATYSKGAAPTLNFVRLYNVDIPGNSKAENKITVSSTVLGTDYKPASGNIPVAWSSSNPKVVTVSNASGNTITLEAHMAGTASITCAAQDGSGKKATVNVSVITPASGIEVTTGPNLVNYNFNTAESNTFSYLSFAKSTSVKATLGTAYGKPSVTKYNWDYEIGWFFVDSKTGKISFDSYPDKYKKNKDFFTFANGKVTCVVPVPKSLEHYEATFWNKVIAHRNAMPEFFNSKKFNESSILVPAIRVIARTTDGTNYEADLVLPLTEPDMYLKLFFLEVPSYFRNNKNFNPYQDPFHYYSRTEATSRYIFVLDQEEAPIGRVRIETDSLYGNIDDDFPKSREYAVVSSNPNVATAYALYDKGLKFDPRENAGYYTGTSVLEIYAQGKGDCTITVSSLDGSGQKVSLKVRVK